MKIFKYTSEITKHIKSQKMRGKRVGFVPTMGYLHKGHLSLIKAAAKDTDLVVVSIFVNPAQFGPREDFKDYPRNLGRDKRLAEDAGADIVFYPSAKEIYPNGYNTYVEVGDITRMLCGASRPSHFKGITTIVTKLFNIITPDIAYFGQKDAQQAIVIKKMARDLNMNIKIKVMPIVREGDGLAMSSRNIYLSKSQREDALVISKSLRMAKRLVLQGESDTKKIRQEMKDLINSRKKMRIDYLSIVNPDNLKELKRIRSKALIAIAASVGKTRLIDNITIGGKI